MYEISTFFAAGALYFGLLSVIGRLKRDPRG